MKRYNLLAAIVCLYLFVGTPSNARQEGGLFEYVSPRPGAKLVSKATTIVVRAPSDAGYSEQANAFEFEVTGSSSGSHTGHIVLADDGRTVIYEPQRSFSPGERVSVTINVGKADAKRSAYTFAFDVSPKTTDLTDRIPLCPEFESGPILPQKKHPANTPDAVSKNLVPQGSYALPSDFPSITINVLDNPDAGYIFLTSFMRITDPPSPDFTPPHLLMLDNSGFPVFFKKITGMAGDFKQQPNGLLTYCVRRADQFYAMDNTYTVVDSFSCGNGYTTDMHELQVLDNGHSLLMAYDPQPVDMSEIVPGGDPNAVVIGLIIQELDASKNVVFQWRSWDHMEITDTVHGDLTAKRIDYVHGNAIELDDDGNLLISSRHISEITKLNRSTGDIIWRLGGKNNQFTFVSDINDSTGFSLQHDIRRLPNGNITLFDNGAYHTPPHSRAVEYELDEVNMTATLVWKYRNDPDIYGRFMGSAQRLPNGNTMIGWGGTNPNATEVRPDGSKAFELTFAQGTISYRAFRFEWKGVAATPYLWAEAGEEDLSLGFVKFGDDDVQKYYIYRGDTPDSATRVDSTTENAYTVTNFVAGKTLYFRVTAVDGGGIESLYSNQVAVTPEFSDIVYTAGVRITPRTLNLKSHGRWINARIELPADCQYGVGDVDLGSIRLNDSVPADILSTPKSGDDGSADQAFIVKFPRDDVAAILPEGKEIEIKVSGSVGDAVFEGFDGITVIRPGGGPRVEDGPFDASKQLTLDRNHPNPFNPATTLRFTLPAPGAVSLRIYDTQGGLVKTLVNDVRAEGAQSVIWNGRDDAGSPLASGVYFVRLEAGGVVHTQKILLLK